MIFRIIAETQHHLWSEPPAAALPETGPGRMAGVWRSGLSTGWWNDDLIMPQVRTARARFWFTEAGRRRYGAPLAAHIRAQGIPVRIHRRKNPPRSEVVYQDAWQVALLPHRPD
jgi:hypothetical protein